MNGNANKSSPFLPTVNDVELELSLKDVFGANRERLCVKLREASNVPPRSVVYLQGGASTTRYDSDHEPLFRQESYFLYLTGVKEPDCHVSIQIDTGFTTLYIPRLPPDYATIMGKIKTQHEWKTLYEVDAVEYTDDVESILEEAICQDEYTNGNRPRLLLMEGQNSDSGNLYKAPSIQNQKLQQEHADTTTLYNILAECRVIKSPAELLIMRFVTELSSFAHAYVMRNVKPEMYEYQSESLFRHYCFYNYGCRLTGYTPICACGPNAAVLHYGHAGEPNSRKIQEGDLLLYDMGAELSSGGYGSDITCSFPANGSFTAKQKDVFEGVLNAQRAVYAILKPGVSWVKCHEAAEAAILTKLAEIGIVVSGTRSIEELVDMRLGAVFMPHGLGHFIGIDTHDVGGYLAGNPNRSTLPGLKSLRTSRIMQENMTVTVEPGCYFIDHLLDEALADDSPLKPFLNAELLEEYRGFGGVRLEDVVAITAHGCVNYTLCPRTVKEIEHVMAGGKWPPTKDDSPELLRERLTDPTPLPSPPSL
jgi:Xaa-Pro dipeptidase